MWQKLDWKILTFEFTKNSVNLTWLNNVLLQKKTSALIQIKSYGNVHRKKQKYSLVELTRMLLNYAAQKLSVLS